MGSLTRSNASVSARRSSLRTARVANGARVPSAGEREGESRSSDKEVTNCLGRRDHGRLESQTVYHSGTFYEDKQLIAASRLSSVNANYTVQRKELPRQELINRTGQWNLKVRFRSFGVMLFRVYKCEVVSSALRKYFYRYSVFFNEVVFDRYLTR